MSNGSDSESVVLHYFVDEAGDPTLFARRRRAIVGEVGCSNYFILGKLEVDDPDRLHHDLETLRANLGRAEPNDRPDSCGYAPTT